MQITMHQKAVKKQPKQVLRASRKPESLKESFSIISKQVCPLLIISKLQKPLKEVFTPVYKNAYDPIILYKQSEPVKVQKDKQTYVLEVFVKPLTLILKD